MSVSWARIELAEGKIDEAALDRYAEIMSAHREAGIRVAVTLLHFAPRWLAARRGVLRGRRARDVHAFARRMVRKLRGSVWQWHTVNELIVAVDNGYRRGLWPPGETSLLRAAAANAPCFACTSPRIELRAIDGAPSGLVHNFAAVHPRDSSSRLD